MIALTVNITIVNLTRVGVLSVEFDEDVNVAYVKMEAKTSVANGDIRYKTFIVTVTDTISTKLARVVSPGNPFEDALAVVPQQSTVNGFTALRTAWYGAANNKAARRAAAETAGLAAGWVDASLAGVVS